MKCTYCNEPIRRATQEEITETHLTPIQEWWIHENGFWSCEARTTFAAPIPELAAFEFEDGSAIPNESLYPEALDDQN